MSSQLNTKDKGKLSPKQSQAAKNKEEAENATTMLDVIKNSKWQLFFLLVGIAGSVSPITIIWEMSTLREYTFQHFSAPSGGWNHYSDFYITIIGALACYTLRRIIFWLFWPSMYRVCSEKKDEYIRVQKTDKGTYSLYKTVYFFSAVAWGYFVLRDEDFIPPVLGGHGSISNLSGEFPKSFIHPQAFRYYALGTMGYHLSEAVKHSQSKRRGDYMEMVLHHMVTIFLYGASYLSHRSSEAALIMYLHDFADGFTQVVKCLVDTTLTTPLTIASVGMVSSWAFTRLIYFPFILYEIWQLPNIYAPRNFAVKDHLLYQLCILLILHYYWFFLISKAVLNFAIKGKKEDTQAKIDCGPGQDKELEKKTQ